MHYNYALFNIQLTICMFLNDFSKMDLEFTIRAVSIILDLNMNLYANKLCLEITFLQICPLFLIFLQSSLVPCSQNSWTLAPPCDLNFSTISCSYKIYHKNS